MDKPNLVVKKSAWRACTFFRIFFFWLIIPLIILIVDIVKLKHDVIYFYDDRIVHKVGVFNKREDKFMFTGVLGVTLDQSLLGRMLNFGDVRIDCVGKWDLNTNGVKNPQALKHYLDDKIVNKQDFNTHLVA